MDSASGRNRIINILIEITIGKCRFIILEDYIIGIGVYCWVEGGEFFLNFFKGAGFQENPACGIKDGGNVGGAVINGNCFHKKAVDELLGEIVRGTAVFGDEGVLVSLKKFLLVIAEDGIGAVIRNEWFLGS